MYRVLHLVILCKNEQEDLVNMYSQILPYLFTYNYIYSTSIVWNSTLVLFFKCCLTEKTMQRLFLIVVRKSILLWESENLCVKDKCQRPISHPKSDDKICQSKHHLTATTISNCHLKLPVIWETFGTEFQDKIYPLFIIYFQYQDCSSFREIRYHIVHLSHIHTRFSLNVNQQQ